METKIEKLKESRIRTTTVVHADERKAAEEQALKALSQRVRIKGFREGTAPADLVRQNVKPEAISEETIRVLLPKVVAEALKMSSAKPIIRPAATIVSMEPLTIALTFVERPEAELKKPDAIKIEKKPITDASAKEVETFVRKLLMQDRTETVVDRAAAKGDLVKLGLSAKDKAGKQVDELTVGHYGTELGADDLLPELEEHVLGMKKGDKKTAEIDFPKTHDIPALQGKRLKLEIEAKEVSEAKLPELTAEYIKSRLGAERTPDAFRMEIAQMLKNQKLSAEMKRREEELYDKVRASTKIEIAPELIDAETQEMLADLQRRLKGQDTTIEQWLEQTGKKWEQVVEEMKAIAKDRIVLRFGMQLFAEHKKIEADPAELKQAVDGERAHAKEHGHPIVEEDLKEGGNTYEQIRWEMKMQKLVRSMIDDAPEAAKAA